MISSKITKKCRWKTSWIDSLVLIYCEKKRASNLFMMRSKVFLIKKCCYKKCKQHYDESYARKSKCIENLIICTIKSLIYIPESNNMNNKLDYCGYPENLSVYTIEYNQEYKIQKRKKCHIFQVIITTQYIDSLLIYKKKDSVSNLFCLCPVRSCRYIDGNWRYFFSWFVIRDS